MKDSYGKRMMAQQRNDQAKLQRQQRLDRAQSSLRRDLGSIRHLQRTSERHRQQVAQDRTRRLQEQRRQRQFEEQQRREQLRQQRRHQRELARRLGRTRQYASSSADGRTAIPHRTRLGLIPITAGPLALAVLAIVILVLIHRL